MSYRTTIYPGTSQMSNPQTYISALMVTRASSAMMIHCLSRHSVSIVSIALLRWHARFLQGPYTFYFLQRFLYQILGKFVGYYSGVKTHRCFKMHIAFLLLQVDVKIPHGGPADIIQTMLLCKLQHKFYLCLTTRIINSSCMSYHVLRLQHSLNYPMKFNDISLRPKIPLLVFLLKHQKENTCILSSELEALLYLSHLCNSDLLP